MRQSCLLLLSLGVLMAFGDTQPDPAQALANKSVELAKQELRKISELVQAGAVARVRLEQAQLDLADAEDDAVLQRTLYGEFPVQNLSDQMADEMVAAAQRRLERQQARIQQARSLVDQGVTPQSSLTPLQEELGLRQMRLRLTDSIARLVGERAAMPLYEEPINATQKATHIESSD